jgi:hypothetical protein
MSGADCLRLHLVSCVNALIRVPAAAVTVMIGGC